MTTPFGFLFPFHSLVCTVTGRLTSVSWRFTTLTILTQTVFKSSRSLLVINKKSYRGLVKASPKQDLLASFALNHFIERAPAPFIGSWPRCQFNALPDRKHVNTIQYCFFRQFTPFSYSCIMLWIISVYSRCYNFANKPVNSLRLYLDAIRSKLDAVV